MGIRRKSGTLGSSLLGCLGGEEIIRKWGTWEDWRHDCAIITGQDRHYILAALTNHPKGDEYLAGLAAAVDDLMIGKSAKT